MRAHTAISRMVVSHSQQISMYRLEHRQPFETVINRKNIASLEAEAFFAYSLPLCLFFGLPSNLTAYLFITRLHDLHNFCIYDIYNPFLPQLNSQ